MKPARRQPEPSPPQRLRDLAHRVRRLGVCGRVTPETVLVEKETVAAELRRLARELERPA
jgi:hypothetical protein